MMIMLPTILIRKATAALAALALMAGPSVLLTGCDDRSPPLPPEEPEPIDEPAEHEYDELDRQPGWIRDEERQEDRLTDAPLKRNDDPLEEDPSEEDLMRDDPLRDDELPEPDRETERNRSG